jgi:hypothetical protein
VDESIGLFSALAGAWKSQPNCFVWGLGEAGFGQEHSLTIMDSVSFQSIANQNYPLVSRRI